MEPQLQQAVDVAGGAEVLQAGRHLGRPDVRLLLAGRVQSGDVTVVQPIQLAETGDTQRLVAAVLPAGGGAGERLSVVLWLKSGQKDSA